MSSKTGAIYGYRMIWLVVSAAALMWSMVALSARLGVVLERTPLGELAHRLGRPVAAAVGLILFLVVVGFQVSNNIAIVAAIEAIGVDVLSAEHIQGKLALQLAATDPSKCNEF